jgi:hypothetical protein
VWMKTGHVQLLRGTDHMIDPSIAVS